MPSPTRIFHCPFEDHHARIMDWVVLPTLPEDFVWRSELSGDGRRYINIKELSTGFILGECVEDGESLEDAAERCLQKLERMPDWPSQDIPAHLHPNVTGRYGVQPVWVRGRSTAAQPAAE